MLMNQRRGGIVHRLLNPILFPTFRALRIPLCRISVVQGLIRTTLPQQWQQMGGERCGFLTFQTRGKSWQTRPRQACLTLEFSTCWPPYGPLAELTWDFNWIKDGAQRLVVEATFVYAEDAEEAVTCLRRVDMRSRQEKATKRTAPCASERLHTDYLPGTGTYCIVPQPPADQQADLRKARRAAKSRTRAKMHSFSTLLHGVGRSPGDAVADPGVSDDILLEAAAASPLMSRGLASGVSVLRVGLDSARALRDDAACLECGKRPRCVLSVDDFSFRGRTLRRNTLKVQCSCGGEVAVVESYVNHVQTVNSIGQFRQPREITPSGQAALLMTRMAARGDTSSPRPRRRSQNSSPRCCYRSWFEIRVKTLSGRISQSWLR